MTWLWSNFKYVAVILGLLLGLPTLWKRQEMLGYRKAWQIGLTGVFFSGASVLSAMALAALEGAIGGSVQPGAISMYGVYLICPLLLLAAAGLLRRDPGRWFDVYAVYALPSLFLMRCNCLKAGCCGGIPFFGTRFTWPTRQIEMIFYIVIGFVLLHREKKHAAKGTAFPLLMCCYGALRFLLEWVRAAEGAGPVHLAHGWSIITFFVGLLFLKKNGKKT